MKTALALLLVSSTAFAPASARPSVGEQDAAKIGWKKDHEAALKEAKKEGKYVVVHFSGPD